MDQFENRTSFGNHFIHLAQADENAVMYWAGLKPVNRQEIVHVNQFENWTEEELRAEWERLKAMH